MGFSNHRWRQRLADINAAAESALACALQYVSYCLGIAFGLGAGLMLGVDVAAAAVNLALAVFFVYAGLAYRSKHHDGDPAAADRWFAGALGTMGVVMTVLSTVWVAADPDRDGFVLSVASLGMVFGALFVWNRQGGIKRSESVG